MRRGAQCARPAPPSPAALAWTAPRRLPKLAAMNEPEIYCPKCGWRPRAEDRWSCVPSCGTVWNTFWTRGVCPGCGIEWQRTQCLACGEVSPHKAWYHWPEGGEPADEETREEHETARQGAN